MDKVIFLDRDGVINLDPMTAKTGKEYITDWSEFHFLPGALEAIKKLTESGYGIFIISNQAGVGKGIYTAEKLNGITRNMLEVIKATGGNILSVQYCTHTRDDKCDCRKPNTGLFRRASEGFDVDFSKTCCVGDAKRDIEAGKKMGCRTILVLSGKTKDRKEVGSWDIKPDFIKKDLKEVAEWL
jgi:D-glycero-D-manno-heptose 1,7-bisphosphate phosphatase